MDVVMLSRLQFAVAVFFHFVFVPLTLGLSVIIAWMEKTDQILGKTFCHQLYLGRGDRDYTGIPVRHQLVKVF